MLLEKIKKPIDDENDYYNISLVSESKKEIQIFYIQSANIDKSICAIKINVGHCHEPDEYLGLAHFLEHMIFMGSKKYPDSNLLQYANTNGGMANAMTAGYETTYYFEVFSKKLYEAFDILVDGLFYPTIAKENVDKEVNAVNAEHMKNIDIVNKSFTVSDKIIFDQTNHPLFRFSTGTLDTLNKDGIVEALKSFHKKYYVPNNSFFVVMHNDSIHKFLEKISYLHKIPTADIEYPIIPNLSMKRKTIHVKDKIDNMVCISIPVPKEIENLRYYGLSIPWFLQSYHKNSLLDILHKKKGLIKNFSVRYDSCDSHMHPQQSKKKNILRIKFLAEKVHHIEKILSYINAYFSFLKNNLPPKYIVDENKAISYYQWLESNRHLGVNDILDIVDANNDGVSYVDYNYIQYKSLSYDKKEIEKLWEHVKKYLSFENSIIAYSKKNISGKVKKIDHYPFEYVEVENSKIDSLSDISSKQSFKHPTKNNFLRMRKKKQYSLSTKSASVIPTIKLLTTDVIYQQLTVRYDNKTAIVFHNSDQRTNYKKSIASQMITDIFDNFFLADINSKLTEINSSLSFYVSTKNVVIEINSYPDLINIIFDTFSKLFNKFSTNYQKQKYKKYFFKQKSSYSKKNNLMDYVYVNEKFSKMNFSKECSYDISETLKAAKAIKYSDISELLKILFDSISSISIYSYGNKSMDIIPLYKKVKQYIHDYSELHSNREEKKKIEYHNCEIVDKSYEYFSTMKNFTVTTIKIFYSISADSQVSTTAYSLLISKLIQQPFFDTLRTKEQLGYVVSANVEKVYGKSIYSGISFFIKSNVKSSKYLLARTKKFISEFFEEVSKNPDDEMFELVKKSAKVLDSNKESYSQNFSLILRKLNPTMNIEIDNFILTASLKNTLAVYYENLIKNPIVKVYGIN